MLSKEELERYSRHLILPDIGLEGQEKLKKSKVIVVGAGGLGCPALQYLVAAGVGTVGICDFDFVDLSNLQRQILYNTSDIGKPKAYVAAKKLSKINPYVDFVVYNQKLKKENVLEIFKQYDLIIDGTDNFPTRFLINDACVILNKPFVFGAIYKFEGQVSVFNYKNGPTYRCLVPEEPYQKDALSCSQVGVMGIIPGLIGCYQAIEAIKILCGVGQILNGKMLIIDALNCNQQIIEIKRNSKTAHVKELGTYSELCDDNQDNIKQLYPKELYDLLIQGKTQVIDIREKEKFNQYHIESINIPVSDLLLNYNLNFEKENIVFLCELGIKSKAVIERLNKSGISGNLYNLNGGIQAWIKRGLPVIWNEF